VEEAYEFFLAFAAQGLTDDRSSSSGSELRGFLARLDESLTSLAACFRSALGTADIHSPEQFAPMIDVLERDASSAQAAVRLVMSRAAISSQLIDNLNASIHVRALLTDIFVLDEALKARGE